MSGWWTYLVVWVGDTSTPGEAPRARHHRGRFVVVNRRWLLARRHPVL